MDKNSEILLSRNNKCVITQDEEVLATVPRNRSMLYLFGVEGQTIPTHSELRDDSYLYVDGKKVKRHLIKKNDLIIFPPKIEDPLNIPVLEKKLQYAKEFHQETLNQIKEALHTTIDKTYYAKISWGESKHSLGWMKVCPGEPYPIWTWVNLEDVIVDDIDHDKVQEFIKLIKRQERIYKRLYIFSQFFREALTIYASGKAYSLKLMNKTFHLTINGNIYILHSKGYLKYDVIMKDEICSETF